MRVWSLIIVGFLLGLAPYTAQGQSNNTQTRIKKLLRRVVPIETTAEDVRKLLGDPVSRSPDLHESDEFNVLVSYTTGLPCEKEPTYGWNVPRGKVNTFTIIIKAAFHQRDLKNISIDLNKYEKAEGDGSIHVPGPIYTNNQEGIRIYINGDQVTSIALFAAEKYLHLMCTETKEKAVCPAEPCTESPLSGYGKKCLFRQPHLDD